MTKNAVELIKTTIMEMTDCDSLEESISYFEGIKKQKGLLRTEELFDELSKAQIATLFKLLIDLKEVECKNNVIFIKIAAKTEEKDG